MCGEEGPVPNGEERRGCVKKRENSQASMQTAAQPSVPPSCPQQLTWHGTERALWVHLGLDGDDSLPLRAPALLALRLHLEDVGVVGQQVLHHHRVLAGVGDGDPVHLSWDTQGRGCQHHVVGTKTELQLSPKLCLEQTACENHPGSLPNHLHHTLPPTMGSAG